MSVADRHGVELARDDLDAPALVGITWADYAAIMRAVLSDHATPDQEERLRLTYVLMDLADLAGLEDHLDAGR